MLGMTCERRFTKIQMCEIQFSQQHGLPTTENRKTFVSNIHDLIIFGVYMNCCMHENYGDDYYHCFELILG
jgi:hypothetical protein